MGNVSIELHESGEVTVGNVPSYRAVKDYVAEVAGRGSGSGRHRLGRELVLSDRMRGLVRLELRNIEELTNFAWRIREALAAEHPEIDHIELFSPSVVADSKNFVLCPG